MVIRTDGRIFYIPSGTNVLNQTSTVVSRRSEKGKRWQNRRGLLHAGAGFAVLPGLQGSLLALPAALPLSAQPGLPLSQCLLPWSGWVQQPR